MIKYNEIIINDEAGYEVVGLNNCKLSKYEIPNEYNGKRVFGIKAGAFSGANIKKLNISSNLDYYNVILDDLTEVYFTDKKIKIYGCEFHVYLEYIRIKKMLASDNTNQLLNLKYKIIMQILSKLRVSIWMEYENE